MKIYVIAWRAPDGSRTGYDWGRVRSLTERIHNERIEAGAYDGFEHALFSLEVSSGWGFDETNAYVASKYEAVLAHLIDGVPVDEVTAEPLEDEPAESPRQAAQRRRREREKQEKTS